MIGFLRGVVISNQKQLILETNGVGYLLWVGESLLAKLNPGEPIELFVHTFVREDRLELFGFADLANKELFLLLLSISGVGPKTALAIADLGANRVAQAVQEAEIRVFQAIPRVGKRLAQKIIIELKPKLGDLKDLELGPLSGEKGQALEALLALGFDETLARQALDSIDLEETDVAILVKLALRQLQ